MSCAVKQKGEPNPVRDCGLVQDGDFEACIPDWDWFAWFVLAIGSAAMMLAAAALWDWLR